VKSELESFLMKFDVKEPKFSIIYL
jgi:hypothetical protein